MKSIPRVAVVFLLLLASVVYYSVAKEQLVTGHLRVNGQIEGSEGSEGALTPIDEPVARSGLEGNSSGEDSDCSYFDAWRELDCTRHHVASFLNSISTLEGNDLSCIPSDWLVVALMLSCDGVGPAPIEGMRRATAEIRSREIDPIEVCRSSILSEVSPAALTCFISNLRGDSATQESLTQAWAWALVSAFGSRGTVFQADADVVDALEVLMLGWPLYSESWWADLWRSLPGDPHVESVNLRIAIFEALRSLIPESDWFERLVSIADLENMESQNGFMSLLGMGKVVNRNISDAMFVLLPFLSDSSNWQRMIVTGIPQELMWPSPGHFQITEQATRNFKELRDSGEYPHLFELLLKQWGILGPEEAILDLENFVHFAIRSDEDWGFSGAVRVVATVNAALTATASFDEDIFSQAEALLQELLLVSWDDSKKIFDVLIFGNLSPGNQIQAALWRNKLAEMLGPNGVELLGKEHQAWLQKYA